MNASTGGRHISAVPPATHLTAATIHRAPLSVSHCMAAPPPFADGRCRPPSPPFVAGCGLPSAAPPRRRLLPAAGFPLVAAAFLLPLPRPVGATVVRLPPVDSGGGQRPAPPSQPVLFVVAQPTAVAVIRRHLLRGCPCCPPSLSRWRPLPLTVPPPVAAVVLRCNSSYGRCRPPPAPRGGSRCLFRLFFSRRYLSSVNPTRPTAADVCRPRAGDGRPPTPFWW